MEKTIRIYTLSDPITGHVRYVGRTVNPLARRLREHINTARRGKLKDKAKEQWIAALNEKGLKPVITLIDEACVSTFQAAEKRWVAHYRHLFVDLLNVKCGGDGGMGGHFVVWTPELDAMLGKVTDTKLAKLMGVTRKTVSYRRDQLGIEASFDRAENKPPPPMGGHNKLSFSPEVVARFGKEPDYKIADEIGVNKSVIARRRRALGIASFAENTGSRGVFTVGMPHPRWSKRLGTQSSPPTN
jgi:hypothetical protein